MALAEFVGATVLLLLLVLLLEPHARPVRLHRLPMLLLVFLLLLLLLNVLDVFMHPELMLLWMGFRMGGGKENTLSPPPLITQALRGPGCPSVGGGVSIERQEGGKRQVGGAWVGHSLLGGHISATGSGKENVDTEGCSGPSSPIPGNPDDVAQGTRPGVSGGSS